ncbi:MAG: chromosome segregation protein SMC [Terriglobales bacterium]
MFKLKKLQILGFKSFCDRAELQFPGSGVVGIVGPNGCGKSNLADAISWVLGEQSAKSLRGGRMEDVIFAGTRDRAATGMAEVSLTLVDPAEYDLGVAEEGAPEPEPEVITPGWGDEGTDEIAEEAEAGEEEEPAAAEAPAGGVVLTIRKRRKFHAHNRRGEVVVTRRLYRDGQSEYLMNGRPCRLRDIQELFMGTGLGPESYAIIEQGRIGQILSSKPYDRRAMIEEAAGVSKYKAKRRQAEARLEAAKLNLSRINDIFEEVTKQVASLKRQAAKAERYRQYKTELDAQQRQWMRRRAAALVEAAAALEQERSELQAAVTAARAAVEALEGGRAAALARAAELEQQVRARGEEAARLRLERDHTAQQAVFARQQAAELEQRGVDNRAAAAQAEQQSGGLAAERDQAAHDADAAGGLLTAARAARDLRREASAAAQAAEAAAERALAEARARGLALLERIAQLGRQAAQDEARCQELERLLERVAGEEAASLAELEAGGARRGQMQLSFQTEEQEADALAAGIRDMEARVAEGTAAAAAARAAEQQARTQWAAAEARRRSLEEIAAGHGYSTEAVQQLFAQHRQGGASGFEPLGVLGEFLEVEAPYDQVVEQFLHEELNYVVVKSWDEAGAGVGLLRAQEQGRATFLVHAEAAAAEAPAAAMAEAGAVPLLPQVKALNGFRGGVGAVLPKLRRAYFLEDAAQARELAARHPEAYFLTPQGECYHHHTVTGGAGRASGPLSLKRELRQLRDQETAAGAAAAHAQQQAELFGRQTAEAQQELERHRGRLHELDKRRAASTQAVRQLESDLERAEARRRQAQLESERLRVEHARVAERCAAVGAERAAGESEQQALAAVQQQSAAALAAAAEARAACGEALSAAQADLARVEERAAAATAALERLDRLGRELQQRREQLRREGGELDRRREELLAAAARDEARAAEVEQQGAAALAAQGACEAALAEARAAAHQDDGELKLRREALEAERQRLNENEVASARLASDGEHLRQSCRDDLNCELEELLALPVAAPEEGAAPELPLEELEAAVRALRQRIENLGPVNMMALEEFDEAQQRHQFMETQRRDLLDSIADTQKAIAEMDTISQQKFQEAFERINENFQETFRVLFGGGQGFLRLSEIEGQTEPGVDIVAQPPGKKLQNALLLSGGEKAMTAMALLLAIFRYQPSPFCLLDEVDAPMDEANVGRFSEMVKQMSGNTQFILITHNKRTMEVAPTLYGVTMPQPGCSRLVSVMVDQEQPRRQAAS